MMSVEIQSETKISIVTTTNATGVCVRVEKAHINRVRENKPIIETNTGKHSKHIAGVVFATVTVLENVIEHKCRLTMSDSLQTTQ